MLWYLIACMNVHIKFKKMLHIFKIKDKANAFIVAVDKKTRKSFFLFKQYVS